ncbi:SpoIIE family protein phosphatase [Colwellia sp. 1_MG-2023]|uniref:ATP-binding SpoIIE family protein phosphatase n=1 Tax=Colwellia sp. 1_MG-2023 TaxID=3062649 RepID=UPI0026E3543F|nr:SpoIIE family protein phosphatase [Colwellia sp. 1_MG-2023]MDO6446082.1 SpoIIE family protein phosphatase [Colwellia sp. 1_MG-2023]
MTNSMTKSLVKLALVVEDSPVQCEILSKLLQEEGYKVHTANDGARGVAAYIEYQPDLVLMDINMPIMNGYEAARKIKSISQKNSLCPLIFITSLDTDQAFIESIEAGGDGILVRPFSPDVFKAKIKSIQRISDLYGELKAFQLIQQKDAQLAEQLMTEVIESRNYGLNKIGMIQKPAALFSGDIHLTALSPNGDVHAMLGDFTGHGLRASIGAIPVSETFTSMTKKGFSLLEIITQINQQLYSLLPADLFLAASFASISSYEKTVCIFNAGLPDTYIFDRHGEVKHKIKSSHPPLGVLINLLSDFSFKAVRVDLSDRVVLLSDGIIEARNVAGEMFDIQRFEQAAKRGVLQGDICDIVLNSIAEFCQDVPQKDDLSLIDIPCHGWDQAFVNDNEIARHKSLGHITPFKNNTIAAWRWQLSLTGERLSRVNPIPMAMNQIKEMEGHAQHWQNVFTILTELYINALDHGVLALDSALKNSPEGFSQYFLEREKKMKALSAGELSLHLSYFPLDIGGQLNITIKDSGQGFDIEAVRHKLSMKKSDLSQLSGRGILLVEKLCDSLIYKKKGTVVEACYLWHI